LPLCPGLNVVGFSVFFLLPEITGDMFLTSKNKLKYIELILA
jgi:hypothetical protein